MFEKLRIKEHMEIVDAAGSHVGTVDEVQGDTIKLTRSDSSDGRHHYIDFDHVDRIADNRAYLKSGAPAPEAREPAGGQFAAGTQRQFSDGQEFGTGERIDPDSYSTQRPGGMQAGATSPETPLFGTSGLGTGVGGSGKGEH